MAFRRTLKHVIGIAIVVSVSTANAFASPIFVAGPFPVAPFAGTVLTFEGFAERTPITTLGGVTFSQPDGGGIPMIDNKPFLTGHESISGDGVLMGQGLTLISAITATFPTPVFRAGAFLSDTVPIGDYPVTAFGAGGVVLESFVVPRALIPSVPPRNPGDPPGFPGSNPACDATIPFTGTGCGVFVGFERNAGDLLAIQFGPISEPHGSGALAIDDFRWEISSVPEPTSLELIGWCGIVGIAFRNRLRSWA